MTQLELATTCAGSKYRCLGSSRYCAARVGPADHAGLFCPRTSWFTRLVDSTPAQWDPPMVRPRCGLAALPMVPKAVPPIASPPLGSSAPASVGTMFLGLLWPMPSPNLAGFF